MNKEEVESGISELTEGYDALMYKDFLNEYLINSDFFNYGYWDEYTKNQQQASEKLMQVLLDFIPDKEGNILDVACGKGGTTRHLLNFYKPENITAINISAKQLETARTNAPGCKFLVMDAVKLDFEKCSFSNIICVEAAFHFNTREKFFKEAYRVLKPGGYLVFSDILMTLEAEKRRKYRTEKNYVKDLMEYKDRLVQMGFRNVDVIDSTKNCWEGHFWSVVTFANEKFYLRAFDQDELYKKLERTYRVVPDIEHYIMAAAQK
jgi:MPBQ/MSBQ methyltransferase